MRDYLTIHNHSGLGEIGISRYAMAAIARRAAEGVSGTKVVPHRAKKGLLRGFGRSEDRFSITPEGVKVVFSKEGKALIRMEVTLPHGVEIAKTCYSIQEAVANNLALMCDMVPFDVQVKVAHIV